MVCTCNMKSSGRSTKNEKKVDVFCIVDRNHERSAVMLDHFKNLKGILLLVESNIENEEGILTIQGKGNYCSKLNKKRKVKN